MSSSSPSDRRFSVTLSEDDLRPHMRKPKPPKPSIPLEREIEALRLKSEKREEVKREVKRRIEEEEKERAQRKRDEQLRQEILKGSSSNFNSSSSSFELLTFPKRRFNNSQYFNWKDDNDLAPRPESRRAHSPSNMSSSSVSSNSNNPCELCTLAMRGAPSKSAACAHIDAFLDAHRS